MKVILVSTKDPAKRYTVLKFDPETKEALLQGKLAPFKIRPFTKARVEKDGYRLVKE